MALHRARQADQNGFVEGWPRKLHHRRMSIDYNEHRPHTIVRGLTPERLCNSVQNGPRGEQRPVVNEG